MPGYKKLVPSVPCKDQQLFHEENVIQLYICVSVVLIWSLCRKEREKLDITLDSTVFACSAELRKFSNNGFFQSFEYQLGLSGMFACHN